MQRCSIQNLQLTEEQERMRRDLRYHFMNPKEKWRAKGTLPIKMILIVIKLIIVTVQIVLFSENNSNEVSFLEGSRTSFKHLFLYHWESSFETLPYPPSSGPFAIYKIEDFFLSVNYALENYYKIDKQAIGPYSYSVDNIPVMTICIFYYRFGEIFPYNHTYSFSQETDTNCTEIKPIKMNDSTEIYDSKEYLKKKNFTIDFNKLLKVDLAFSLRSIQLKSYEMDESPDCLQFDINILFDNGNHNGQMKLSLQAEMTSFDCVESTPTIQISLIIKKTLLSLDILALIFSLLSLVLSSRSLIKLYQFWKKTKSFFHNEMNIDISDKWKYFWGIAYVIIFIGDILVISGTILKMDMYTLARKDIDRFTLCNYFLGFGLFLGHLTLVRYFSYFPKSSLLVNTIRAAMPPLLRFSLCSSLLYLAFSLLGWIILGPYHIKFRTIDSAIACLFSLMLGDDMYVTLSVISHSNTVIYIFSQLFIYLFCVLFIFVVLNLILTIIYEAYEEAEKQEAFGGPLDAFWDFINSCPESNSYSMYKHDLIHDNDLNKKQAKYLTKKCVDILCCCIGKANHNVAIITDDDRNNEDIEISSNFASNRVRSGDSNYLNPEPIVRRKESRRRKDTNYGSLINNIIRKKSNRIGPVYPSRDRCLSI